MPIRKATAPGAPETAPSARVRTGAGAGAGRPASIPAAKTLAKSPVDNPAIGAQLLDVVVRLNRWVSHRSAWTPLLTLAQARILSQIDALGQPCISDLAQAEHCTQPTMTAQIRRLQGQGMIARQADPRDGRVARVSLTAQGQQALAEARRARAEIVESLIAQLDTAGRLRLQEALQTLSRLLDTAYHVPVIQKESSES